MVDVELLITVPVLHVSSVPESVAFYRDQLGFATEFEMPGGTYAGVRRGDMVLHLDGGAHEFANGPTCCRFHIRGVDALFAEFEPRGIVKEDEPLRTMPHGLRQFSVLDRDRNRITFAEPVG
jgi:catechol 2,3-dioxygenase-like lactoylglutathione lyase family enzyme